MKPPKTPIPTGVFLHEKSHIWWGQTSHISDPWTVLFRAYYTANNAKAYQSCAHPWYTTRSSIQIQGCWEIGCVNHEATLLQSSVHSTVTWLLTTENICLQTRIHACYSMAAALVSVSIFLLHHCCTRNKHIHVHIIDYIIQYMYTLYYGSEWSTGYTRVLTE